MTENWIYPLNQIGQEHNELVGKKCANMGEMMKLGMQVPPGFAISLEGFEKYMEETGLGDRIRTYFTNYGTDLKNDLRKQMDASRTIRDMIAETPLPDEMVETISRSYESLCVESGRSDLPVAVRSSGVVSMPGQMETFLHIQGSDEVIKHVRAVWESTFNTRAIAFRLENGMPVASAPIGVAVLRMVNAKSAGVILTVIPTTGDFGHAVIEGNWGLGESVVSGEISPDRFVVNKMNFAISKIVNKKTRWVISSGRGTNKADVPMHLQDAPCLEDDEIRELARIAMQVENHFGVPQDMEWVIDSGLPFPENIFWVQARPAKFASKSDEADANYIVDQMARLFRR